MGEPARLERTDLEPSRPSPRRHHPPRDRIVELNLSPRAERLYRMLGEIRLRNRKVVQSVQTLAKKLGVTDRTVRRYLSELAAAEQVQRVYNGGRGARCITYVGHGAALHASQRAPKWEKTFGTLRKGRAAIARSASVYPDKNVRVNDVHSLSDLRGSERDHRAVNDSAGEPTPIALLQSNAPPAPLSGGENLTTANSPPSRPKASAIATPAPNAPCTTDVPPNPQRGRKEEGQLGKGRGSQAPRPRAWKTHPQLWRAAWGMWRTGYQIRFGEHPLPHDYDAMAMHGLINAALFAAAQNQSEALRYLAWWLGKYVHDRRPVGAHPDEPHALWRLAQSATRNSYKRPPASWTPKTQAELEAVLAARAARKPKPAAGGPGPAPTPAKNLVLAERALATLEGEHARSNSNKSVSQIVAPDPRRCGETAPARPPLPRVTLVPRPTPSATSSLLPTRELAEARRVLAWLEQLEAKNPLRQFQLDRQRRWVAALEQKVNGAADPSPDQLGPTDT